VPRAVAGGGAHGGGDLEDWRQHGGHNGYEKGGRGKRMFGACVLLGGRPVPGADENDGALVQAGPQGVRFVGIVILQRWVCVLT